MKNKTKTSEKQTVINKEEYYKHLSRVQNHSSIVSIIDIMTITAFMDTEAKLIHLAKYAEQTLDSKAIDYLETFNI